MKIKLADLREMRSDIASFKQRMANPSGGELRKFGRFRALILAISKYHSEGNDMGKAVQYLENTYWRNFKHQKPLDALIQQLHEYAVGFRSIRNTVVKCRFNIIVNLSDAVALSGEVGRLDLAASGGYAAWMLLQDAGDWRSDPRFPILQGHFADEWQVPTDEVVVGVYDFAMARYETISYTYDEIDETRNEILRIAKLL